MQPTAMPHRAHPTSARAGQGERETSRYPAIHRMVLAVIKPVGEGWLRLYAAYTSRDRPISRAKDRGPARSPTVLDTPSADSAKALAHWEMESSLAPAQAISSRNSQNRGVRNSCPRERPDSPSGVRVARGTWVNTRALTRGSRAQSMARMRQF